VFGCGGAVNYLIKRLKNKMQKKSANKKIIVNSIILILIFGSIFIYYLSPKILIDNCEEFKEDILWSSGYSNEQKGSINYQTWYPKYNCKFLNVSNCIIESLELETRFLYVGEDDKQGEGFIQISNIDKSICENPEQGIYEKYLAYETLIGESQKIGQYCGDNKNLNKKCGVEKSDNYLGNLCYGIRVYADRQFIVDAFEVKYKICKKMM